MAMNAALEAGAASGVAGSIQDLSGVGRTSRSSVSGPPPGRRNSSFVRNTSFVRNGSFGRFDTEDVFERSARITLNIAGVRFDVPLAVLTKYPETLLGNPLRFRRHYDATKDEYYFNRDRACFEAILQYYQSGQLRRPASARLDTFVQEVRFFDLGHEALVAFCQDEGFFIEKPVPLPRHPLQRRVWQIVEVPHSSVWAKCFAITSMLFIVLSIFVFCIDTLPQFRDHAHHHPPRAEGVTFAPREVANINTASEVVTFSPGNVGTISEVVTFMPGNVSARLEVVTFPSGTVSPLPEGLPRGYAQFQRPLFIAETVCIGWFTLEFILRALTCPSKRKFIRAPLEIIDVLAVIPYYIHLIIILAALRNSQDAVREGGVLLILRILRLVRVFRIFKLSRYSRGLQMLGQTFWMSIRELGLLLLFLGMGVILFSSAVYYAEQGYEDTQLTSIPEAFWWAIVTMTTVGYGDVSPKTVFGKIVGSACAISGLIVVALPVPIIVSKFNTVYQREADRVQMEEILADILKPHDVPVLKRQTYKPTSNGRIAEFHIEIEPIIEEK